MAGIQRKGFLTLFCVFSLTQILSFFTESTTAAFFYVQESQDKCFIESVPTAVALTATYKNHDNPGVTCSIIFKDPTGKSVYSREVLPSDTEGKVAHMTVATGEYQDLAKKDHVNSVHLKLQAIARRVEAMQAENDYERAQNQRGFVEIQPGIIRLLVATPLNSMLQTEAQLTFNGGKIPENE
ncbi:hypothetical protein ACSSS7_005296 [Eimeria intestinalis]